jgi:hypothetical protein
LFVVSLGVQLGCTTVVGFSTLRLGDLRRWLWDMATSEIDNILARLRALFDEQYHRGEQDAIERLVAAARGGASNVSAKEPKQRRKSPVQRGAPEAFARRVLVEGPSDGLMLADIIGRADTPEERAISHEAIRICLWRGQKKGWAKNINGKWFLTEEAKN